MKCYKDHNVPEITTSMIPTDITVTLNPYLSIITLNVNELNAPTKRHRVSEWIKKQDPSICHLPETHFKPEDTFRLKVRDGDLSIMLLEVKRKLE